MDWDEFLSVHARELQRETPYEYRFVDRVLRHVDGLRPDDVQLQREFDVSEGKGYIDFAVVEDSGVRLAIEVSGWDKTGSGTGPDRRQLNRSFQRRNELQRQGWHVLEYSNSQFMTGPIAVRRQIAEVLASLRSETRQQSGNTETPPSGESSGVVDRASPRSHNRVIWVQVVIGLLIVAGVAYYLLDAASRDSVGVDPTGAECPTTHPVKGNVNEAGDRIFHVEGQRFFDATVPERCFQSPQEAEAGGFRASRI